MTSIVHPVQARRLRERARSSDRILLPQRLLCRAAASRSVTAKGCRRASTAGGRSGTTSRAPSTWSRTSYAHGVTALHLRPHLP
ncbi:MAG: hypothetical protein MZU95_14705 [Desulfomicrobium escambiense]|nr:hypothetical protein [Desulfomicrobium escambiense]